MSSVFFYYLNSKTSYQFYTGHFEWFSPRIANQIVDVRRYPGQKIHTPSRYVVWGQRFVEF